jgi:hypothetical protein
MSSGSGQETWVGIVEDSFILKTECISYIMKFDSKQSHRYYPLPTSSKGCPGPLCNLSPARLLPIVCWRAWDTLEEPL